MSLVLSPLRIAICATSSGKMQVGLRGLLRTGPQRPHLEATVLKKRFIVLLRWAAYPKVVYPTALQTGSFFKWEWRKSRGTKTKHAETMQDFVCWLWGMKIMLSYAETQWVAANFYTVFVTAHPSKEHGHNRRFEILTIMIIHMHDPQFEGITINLSLSCKTEKLLQN